MDTKIYLDMIIDHIILNIPAKDNDEARELLAKALQKDSVKNAIHLAVEEMKRNGEI